MTFRISSSRLVIAAVAMFAAVGCSQADGNTGSSTSATATSYPGAALGKMTIGNPDAPVKIVEYASITCGHCKTFHDTGMQTVKARAAAGDVHFTFMEFPTPPANVAVAGFHVARCAGADKYFDVLDDMFENQMGLLSAARNGTATTALQTIAARHGVEQTDFNACVDNTEIRTAIIDIIEEGEALGVNSTPTIFVNGERLTRAIDYTADGMAAVIDGALGIEASAPAE